MEGFTLEMAVGDGIATWMWSLARGRMETESMGSGSKVGLGSGFPPGPGSVLSPLTSSLLF